MAKKINFHTVAVRYLKRNGVKAKGSSWKSLRPLLSEVSGIPSPRGMGYKAGGIAILKKLGYKDPGKERRKVKKEADVNSAEFLASYEWRKLRMKVLKKYEARCMCCGATRENGVQLHVDHIKPRKRYPELALDINNLQILCEVCNHGKGNWDETDWRDSLTEQFKATLAE